MGNVRVSNPSYQQQITSPGQPETLVVVKQGPPGVVPPGGNFEPVEYVAPASQTTHLVTHDLGRDPVVVQVLVGGEDVMAWTLSFPNPGHTFVVGFEISAQPVIRFF